MFCNACNSNPCACRPSGHWIIQRCECRTTIRVPAGQQSPVPVCKWCKGK